MAPSWDLGAGPPALPAQLSVQNCHLSVNEQAAETDFDLFLDHRGGGLFSETTRDANHSLRIYPKNGDRNRCSLSGDRGDPNRRIRRTTPCTTTLTFTFVTLSICDSKCRQHDNSDRCHSGCFADKFFNVHLYRRLDLLV